MLNPVVAERPAQQYVAIRAQVTMQTIGAVLPPLHPQVFAWLGSRSIPPAGPPFWKYNVVDMERELLVEVGVPVASGVEGDGEIRPGMLPAGRFATMTHTGAPYTLAAATAELLDWAQARGLAWDVTQTDAGEHWGCRVEFYLTNPADQPDASKWQTQLAFRLAD